MIKLLGSCFEQQAYGPDLLVWLLLLLSVPLLIYRQQYFFSYVSIAIPIFIISTAILQCMRESVSGEYDFSECWSAVLIYVLVLVIPFIYSFSYLSFGYVMNRVSARKQGYVALRLHKSTWKAELSIARDNNSVYLLCCCADAITRELKRQRQDTLGLLTVDQRIYAWLKRRSGRMCLYSADPKACQSHADIDLLFREATAVSVCVCIYIYIYIYIWCIYVYPYVCSVLGGMCLYSAEPEACQSHADIELLFREATAVCVCVYIYI